MSLVIHLLGQPKLLLDSSPLPFNAPPKTLPLLAYILLHRFEILERQQVAFALWPDEPESAARANLRRHLHHLQRVFPSAHPASHWLLGDTRTIRWNTASDVWLDVAEFERLASNPETLPEAVRLYTGDLLETIYDDWIFFERERLQQMFHNCLSQLVFQYRACRDFSTAIAFAQQLLAHDPFREDTLRQLIALRYESGDRASAIQDYEAFEHRLRQEMDVAPMPETQALREMILRNARLPGITVTSTPKASQAPIKPSTISNLPFVGRTDEMSLLTAFWDRATHGRGSLVLIGGEAGVGKTRLARELALHAEQQGSRVLYGGSTPGELRPYQAVCEVLQASLPLLAAIDNAPLHLAALAALIPELKTRLRLPSLPPLDPDRERTRLFDAIATCLTKLAEPRPLLIILEDWHWAGEASVALLEFLARRATGHPLLIIGTYREEETPRIHPLRALRRCLQTENLAEHLPLSRLSFQAVASLVSQIATSQGELANRLYAESEGNPLFIEMLWQSWQESSPAASPPSPTSLPGGVRTAITRRLERLPAPSRAYAEVAAVLGSAFDAEVVREVGGWDEAQAFDALRELLDSRLVRDAESRSRFDYIFSHHLIQTTLYTETPPAKRKRRHHRAAEILESLYPARRAEMSAELASHYDHGGAPAQAIPHYLASAHQRLSIFADAEALSDLDRALHLAGESPDNATTQTVVELLLARESIHYRRGERSEQHTDLQRLQQFSESDPELKCDVLRRLILYHKGKDERAIHQEMVIALKGQAHLLGSPRWQAEAAHAEGNYLKLINEFPAAIPLLQEALELYKEIGDCRGQVSCCCTLSEGYIDLRQSAEAEAWARKALALCDSDVPVHQLMNTLWNISANGLVVKDLPRCLSYAQKLLETAEQAHDPVWQAAAHRLMGMAYRQQFRIPEARRHLNAALERYTLSQKPKGCALTIQILGHVELSLGNYPAARQHYQQAFDIEERLGDLNGMASEAINLSCAAAFQEDYPADRSYAQQALSFATRIDNHFLQAVALQNLGEAESYLGDLPSACQHILDALALLDDPSLVNERTSILADLALVELKAGDLPAAIQAAEEVISLYPQVAGTDDNVHRYLWAAAQVLLAAGQTKRAHQSLAQAYQDFQRDLSSIPDPDARQAFTNMRHNRQITAAYERDNWP
ncbi:MAG: AAA family ATPase [Anaerolineales bacterium]|nr:AAA family ATPase [Anaerolineales bacterium]